MGDVVFRRINGRIVPIRKSGDTKTPGPGKKVDIKKAAVGAAIAATGVAGGIYAGRFAAKMVVSSALLENTARSLSKQAKSALSQVGKSSAQMSLPLKARKLATSSIKTSTFSLALFRNRKVVRNLGIAAAGGLISAGGQEIYEAVTGKKPSVSTNVISGATGGAAAFLVNAGYYKRLSGGPGLTGWKNAFSSTLRAFKLIK